MMKKMTPSQCAARWGITKMEVMKKIYSTLLAKADKGYKGNNTLPESFSVLRIGANNYVISVPDGYKFKRHAIAL